MPTYYTFNASSSIKSNNNRDSSLAVIPYQIFFPHNFVKLSQSPKRNSINAFVRHNLLLFSKGFVLWEEKIIRPTSSVESKSRVNHNERRKSIARSFKVTSADFCK